MQKTYALLYAKFSKEYFSKKSTLNLSRVSETLSVLFCLTVGIYNVENQNQYRLFTNSLAMCDENLKNCFLDN